MTSSPSDLLTRAKEYIRVGLGLSLKTDPPQRYLTREQELVRDPLDLLASHQQEPLADSRLRDLWRAVNGPWSELNGPLIRFAGLVRAANHPPEPPKDIADALHRVLTGHGIASYQLQSLVTDLIHWAAESYRQTYEQTAERLRRVEASHQRELERLREDFRWALGYVEEKLRAQQVCERFRRARSTLEGKS